MNKLIFVTGASSGIGRSLAIKFANNGLRVIACARRLDLLKKLKKTCNNPDAIIPVRMDITNKRMIDSQVKKIIKNHGIPDIILLNAGTNNPNSKDIFSIEETTSRVFRKTPSTPYEQHTWLTQKSSKHS